MRTLSLLKGLMAIAFVLLGVELLFRQVIFPDYKALQQDMYVNHPLFRHYNKPNLAIRRYNPFNWDVVNYTNLLGMRGKEKDRTAELAGLWIGGDSNTFGGYVADEDVYVHRLRKHGYLSANLASEGHNTSHQAVVVRWLAAEGYRPRAVLIGLSMYNGMTDFEPHRPLLDAPLPSRTKPSSVTASDKLIGGFQVMWHEVPRGIKWVRALLIRNSAAYGWFKAGIMSVSGLRDWTLRAGLRADLKTVFNHDIDLLRPYSHNNPAAAWAVSTADFAAALRDWVDGNLKVPFGIVIFPGYHQLYPEHFPYFLEKAGLSGQDLDPQRPLHALVAALRERNVPVLDLLPALRASRVEPLTFPDDGHLNPQAHAVVAQAVANWLRDEMKVVPQP
ncbi:MAG: hypothetical protein H7841_00475 [Magnetospirillum sp. WYHS-4]